MTICRPTAGGGTLADSESDSVLTEVAIKNRIQEGQAIVGRPSFLFAVAYATLRTNKHNEESVRQESAGNSSACGRLVRLRENQGIRILLGLIDTVPDELEPVSNTLSVKTGVAINHEQAQLVKKKGRLVVKLRLRDGEKIQDAVKRFRKLVEHAGIKKEMRRREYYEKPSDTDRRNRRRAERRARLNKAT